MIYCLCVSSDEVLTESFRYLCSWFEFTCLCTHERIQELLCSMMELIVLSINVRMYWLHREYTRRFCLSDFPHWVKFGLMIEDRPWGKQGNLFWPWVRTICLELLLSCGGINWFQGWESDFYLRFECCLELGIVMNRAWLIHPVLWSIERENMLCIFGGERT